MRTAVLAALGTMVLIAPSDAQTRSVTGQAGILAEWDLTATVTEQRNGHWTGPLVMKHVGFCSADGPEEKTGELRLAVSDPPGETTATLLIDGVACTFKGHGDDGVLACPDRPGVPMMLMIQ